MNGGFKNNRYGTTKWEESQEATKKDALGTPLEGKNSRAGEKKPRTSEEVRDLVTGTERSKVLFDFDAPEDPQTP